MAVSGGTDYVPLVPIHTFPSPRFSLTNHFAPELRAQVIFEIKATAFRFTHTPQR